MNLKSLKLRNFRNHEELSVEFTDDTTLITGPNGSGKTSILEAIYCLYRGGSFRSSDVDIIQSEKDWYYIEAHDNSGSRSLGYRVTELAKEKKFTVDSVKHSRLPAKLKQPIVLFTPDDLQLLTGSPARRRRYIDTVITQLHPEYGTALRRYERALSQRNKLLKQPGVSPDTLFSWNVVLSEYGSTIINRRVEMSERIDTMVTDYYRRISSNQDVISVHYSAAAVSAQKLLGLLERSYDTDRLQGVTTVGPHRHDLAIQVNGKPAAATASRGENRTMILALKQLEAELLEGTFGASPVVLLDDVFSELDNLRQGGLVKYFSDYQTIVASVNVGSSANASVSVVELGLPTDSSG